MINALFLYFLQGVQEADRANVKKYGPVYL